MKKQLLFIPAFAFSLFSLKAQTVKLENILDQIQVSNPILKMYDADIRSSDEKAKGARNWEAPQIGTGFWMTPYNPNTGRKEITVPSVSDNTKLMQNKCSLIKKD